MKVISLTSLARKNGASSNIHVFLVLLDNRCDERNKWKTKHIEELKTLLINFTQKRSKLAIKVLDPTSEIYKHEKEWTIIWFILIFF